MAAPRNLGSSLWSTLRCHSPSSPGQSHLHHLGNELTDRLTIVWLLALLVTFCLCLCHSHRVVLAKNRLNPCCHTCNSLRKYGAPKGKLKVCVRIFHHPHLSYGLRLPQKGFFAHSPWPSLAWGLLHTSTISPGWMSPSLTQRSRTPGVCHKARPAKQVVLNLHRNQKQQSRFFETVTMCLVAIKKACQND